MKTQIAAIDFGTSKIVTLIAANGGMDRCEIVGSGTVPYDGYSDGDWNTPGQMLKCVRESIAAAELEANSKIREIYIGVPGEYIRVRSGEAEIELGDGEIGDDEINAVQDCVADRLQILDEGGFVLHRSPAWFCVDEGKKTMAPAGMRGQKLKASITFIVADPQFVDDMTELMGQLNITILGFLSPTLGQSLLLLTLDDRDRTSLLIDVGYLNTELSVVEGDAIVYHAILMRGGGHITSELSQTLGIPMRAAEQIKRRYVFNPDEFDMDSVAEATDEDGRRITFPRETVSRCVEHTMDELCSMIDMTIRNDAAAYLGSRSQVFVTGGGVVLMRGGREYLAAKLGRAVKVPVAKSAKLNSPVYASALGLVDLVFDSIESPEAEEGNLGNKLKSLFKRG
ncbi:MAG: cell division FtsA domain-containing protein [Eubacteriales bacterium]|nr:cell division FtsA domain-containing protein [Eubacteriales bacterium]